MDNLLNRIYMCQNMTFWTETFEYLKGTYKNHTDYISKLNIKIKYNKKYNNREYFPGLNGFLRGFY